MEPASVLAVRIAFRGSVVRRAIATDPQPPAIDEVVEVMLPTGPPAVNEHRSALRAREQSLHANIKQTQNLFRGNWREQSSCVHGAYADMAPNRIYRVEYDSPAQSARVRAQ